MSRNGRREIEVFEREIRIPRKDGCIRHVSMGGYQRLRESGDRDQTNDGKSAPVVESRHRRDRWDVEARPCKAAQSATPTGMLGIFGSVSRNLEILKCMNRISFRASV